MPWELDALHRRKHIGADTTQTYGGNISQQYDDTWEACRKQGELKQVGQHIDIRKHNEAEEYGLCSVMFYFIS